MQNDNCEQQRVAKKRKQMGLPKLEKVPRGLTPHPSRGGSKGYDIHLRQAQVDLFNIGAENGIIASSASIYRWKNRIEPYKTTGTTSC